MPEISVIVPVFNSRTYLKECIESVTNQIFSDWELLLVNDGSTDDSESICRSYAERDSRVKLISKSNGGLSSARNLGLELAHGNYIFFLDSDDELYSDALSHLYEIASANNSDITIGRAAYASSKPDQGQRQPVVRIVDPHQLCIDTLYQKTGTDNSACWRLFRRSLFDNLRFYNGWYEDLEIFHKLLFAADKVAITDKLVYFYRKHPKSFINSWSDGRRDIIKVTESILTRYSYDPQIRKAALNRHFSANYNLLLALLRDKPDDNESIEFLMSTIRDLRASILTDKNSRMKNRIGALISYMGLTFIKRLS
ncbi:MAG: glycosyltransferase [Muribaculaceae bacterium]|nr:glycosyltransferase [Muribaculaceae bacterium]